MATTTRSQAGQQDQVYGPASLIIATQAMTLAYTDGDYEDYEDDDESYDDDDEEDYEEYEEDYEEQGYEEEDDNKIIATQLRQHAISHKRQTPPTKPDSSPEKDIATTECAICKAEYDDSTAHMVHLPCHKTHTFHRACIRKWANHSPTCPCCRAGIPAAHLARTACAICKLEYDDCAEDVVFLLCHPSHAFHHDCLFRGRRFECRGCPCCGCEVPVRYRVLSLLVREMRRVGVEDPRMVCVPEVEEIIAGAEDQEQARRELYGYWLGRWS